MATNRAIPLHSRGGKKIDLWPRSLLRTSQPRRNGGYNTSFLGRDTKANWYQRPTTALHLNTEGYIRGITEQLISEPLHLVTLFHETHCHNAEKLVQSRFVLAGAILSRKHGIASTFVHEKFFRNLASQFSIDSVIECLCVLICGFKIVNVYKS